MRIKQLYPKHVADLILHLRFLDCHLGGAALSGRIKELYRKHVAYPRFCTPPFGPPDEKIPNDLRCGFRKLKERGVGNRPSGAVLVPKYVLLLLLLAVRATGVTETADTPSLLGEEQCCLMLFP